MRVPRPVLIAGFIIASPLIVAAAVLPLVAIAMILLDAWIGSSTTVYSVARSPDGRHEARVEFSDCGAACAFSRDVMVRRVGVPWSDCMAFKVHGEWPLSLQWSDNTHLVIGDPAPANARRSKSGNCGAVAIRVRPSA